MELVLQNITYHQCPVEVREKVSLSDEQRRDMLRALLGTEDISEAAILQTCNRTEIYFYAKKGSGWKKPLQEIIGRFNPEAGQTWQKYSRHSTAARKPRWVARSCAACVLLNTPPGLSIDVSAAVFMVLA